MQCTAHKLWQASHNGKHCTAYNINHCTVHTGSGNHCAARFSKHSTAHTGSSNHSTVTQLAPITLKTCTNQAESKHIHSYTAGTNHANTCTNLAHSRHLSLSKHALIRQAHSRQQSHSKSVCTAAVCCTSTGGRPINSNGGCRRRSTTESKAVAHFTALGNSNPINMRIRRLFPKQLQ
jgi:hypothetical protein